MLLSRVSQERSQEDAKWSTFRSSRVTVLLCTFLSLLAGVSDCIAGEAEVSLTWDPVTSESLLGYRLYYGTSSGNYDFSIDVGDHTNYTVSGLESGTVYFFAVTAIHDSPYESEFSNELIYTTSLASVDDQFSIRSTFYDTVNVPVISDSDISQSQSIYVPISVRGVNSASCAGVVRIVGLNASQLTEPWASVTFTDPYDLVMGVRTGVGMMAEITLSDMRSALIWVGARNASDYYTVVWWSDGTGEVQLAVLGGRQSGEHRLLVGVDKSGTVDFWLDDSLKWSAGLFNNADLYLRDVYLVGESSECGDYCVVTLTESGLGYCDRVSSLGQ